MGQLLRRVVRVAYPVTAAVDVVLAGSSSAAAHRARRVTKPALLPLLTLGTAAAPAGRVRGRVLLGQACGWFGDVVLLDDGDRALVLGATAFGCGHLAYHSAFEHAGSTRVPPGTTAAAVAAAAGLALLAASPLAAARRTPTQALTLATYSFLLGRTPARAVTLPHGTARRRSAITGGALFALSDSLLFARKVLLRDPPPALEAAVMATYCAAQALIAEFAAADSG